MTHRDNLPKTNAMLEGPILTPILAFAFPVFLGNLFQQLYNLVDTIIVGKSLGTLALAGVGSTTGLSFFTISLCNGLCNGFAVLAAQKYGAEDKKALKRCFGNAIVLVSMLTILITFIKKNVQDLHITRHELKIDANISKKQLSTAFPMALQGIVISLGILIVQTATNGMGALYVAGSTAGNKLYGVMSAPIDALCQAMVPFSGQNYGAGNYGRIHKGLKKVMLLTWSTTAALVIIAWFAGPLIMTMFVDASEVQVIKYGHQFLLFFVMGFGFLSVQMAFCNTLQGMGFAKYTVPSGILECAGRMVGAVVLSRTIGYTGICLALPLAWVFTAVYIVPIYFRCRKKLNDIQ